jgi:hypothetical protein
MLVYQIHTGHDTLRNKVRPTGRSKVTRRTAYNPMQQITQGLLIPTDNSGVYNRKEKAPT